MGYRQEKEVTQHLFVEEKYYGSVQLPEAQSFNGGWHRNRSTFFLCRSCARIWARLPVDDYDGWWHCIEATCERCYWPMEVPGSILTLGIMESTNLELLEVLPKELADRELMLHLNNLFPEEETK